MISELFTDCIMSCSIVSDVSFIFNFLIKFEWRSQLNVYVFTFENGDLLGLVLC